ncbi:MULTISPECIES: type IV pilus biogenesis protein PilP [unclassified Herbaspirillum]|uniref:type IV pilus biogenesis protein PilP n=1 Tax=unclassified Herbaspirillum TaxID=2624150 RepID=UPI00114E7EA3|nr:MULTISPECIES: type IV pilus biogenesis protein PilP [unclassified Herbaspirillum]MBB5391336.1 type IV pilus biogenesis protein PilP [Herbaspirillum sp. SJZ102]TQK12977.1 type IV pilus biogenesis protein PilP [Herbaspirillum sp. SJZ130]TQK14981.1 type IV pilus biogenesis protein PilP [Herbaspirillum sp. SJZ106]
MQNKTVIARRTATAMLAVAAWTASPAHAESTSESLTRIEAETMVLKAREKQLEVQASIVTKQNEIAARQSVTAALNQPEVVGDPVVRAIEGIGSRMYATLQLSDGSLVDVQQGDTLPGGMKIVAVHPREVLASSKGRQFRLGTYAPALTGFNPNFPGPGVSPVARGAAR